MISMSGAFSVTFSVIFAYVADVTSERERSTAYGLVRSLDFECAVTGFKGAVRTFSLSPNVVSCREQVLVACHELCPLLRPRNKMQARRDGPAC